MLQNWETRAAQQRVMRCEKMCCNATCSGRSLELESTTSTRVKPHLSASRHLIPFLHYLLALLKPEPKTPTPHHRRGGNTMGGGSEVPAQIRTKGVSRKTTSRAASGTAVCKHEMFWVLKSPSHDIREQRRTLQTADEWSGRNKSSTTPSTLLELATRK